MLEMAAALGSDVPFFLLGGRALGIGRGAEVYGLPAVARQWLVLAWPPIHVDTAHAYKALDGAESALTESLEMHKIYSFCCGDSGSLGNDFEPVVFAIYPQIARLKKFLVRAGAFPALLSGSGSAVFGVFENRRKADGVSRKVQARFPDCKVWVLRTVNASEALRIQVRIKIK